MFRLSPTLRNTVRVILVLAVLIVAAGVIIDRDTNKFTLQTAVGQTNDTLQTSEDFLHLERANRAFIDLVAWTRPAVVQITTKTERVRVDTSQREEMSPEEFRRFFGDDSPFRFFFEERPPRLQQEPRQALPDLVPTQGIGSGVIVSEDGYILTNNHVIDGADEITVTLATGHAYEAKLIGSDPALRNGGGSDLAVVKIEAKDLPALAFGDSDALEVGEWVIAIGTPFNLSQTVTRGIVSAKGRDKVGNIPFSSFIQTDAPINRGNSGGALINIRGELVGINTMIASNFSMGNIGLGFAIPSNTARNNMIQLIEHGEVERGWLGIRMRAVDRDLAEKLNLEIPRGVLVETVGMKSPAQKAGIQRGDVIVSFDGQEIRDWSHLRHVVGATQVGKSVDVLVLRKGGKEKQLTVKLGKRTQEVSAALNESEEKESPSVETESFAGIRVQNLTPAIAERYGYPSDEKGVIVTQVERGSDAAKKGIIIGSLIQEMEWTSIDNLETYSQLAEQLTNENKRQVLLYVKAPNGQRGGYVTVKVSTSDR